MKSRLSSRLSGGHRLQMPTVRLSHYRFVDEIEDLIFRGALGRGLGDAMKTLIDLSHSKRDVTASDLPLAERVIVRQIKDQLNDGIFFIGDSPFQICILKSRCSHLPSRLTLHRLPDQRFRVYCI